MPVASIVIPTINRADSLARTLKVLCTQATQEAEFEILVVDNGSGDHTRKRVVEAMSSLSKNVIKYFLETIPGLLSARHRGALEARSGVLIFIDDDIDVCPGWLSSILEGFKDPDVHLIGGRNLPLYETEPPNWLDSLWTSTPYGGRMCVFLSLLDLGDAVLIVDANYVWGLNLAIRRETLFQLGGFHPDGAPYEFRRYQGDGETGLTRKANDFGFRALYQPGATVWHRIPAARLTPNYFAQRAFFEGVVHSYSTIRRYRRVSEETWQARFPLADAFSGATESYAPFPAGTETQAIAVDDLTVSQADKILHLRHLIRGAFVSGFEFHHGEVSRDPGLLNWVLREDYWNYEYPKMPPAAKH